MIARGRSGRMSGANSDGILGRLGKPPANDELELAVFGPGTGESILVHLGAGEWLCVDCARFRGRVWPLVYLEALGVPATAIKLIIASHWHTDHVDGLS